MNWIGYACPFRIGQAGDTGQWLSCITSTVSGTELGCDELHSTMVEPLHTFLISVMDAARVSLLRMHSLAKLVVSSYTTRR